MKGRQNKRVVAEVTVRMKCSFKCLYKIFLKSQINKLILYYKTLGKDQIKYT